MKQKIHVRDHGRCPYCHDTVEQVAERAACAHCLAVHHQACWREHGSCAACGQDEPLLPPEATPAELQARGVQEPSAGGPFVDRDQAQRTLDVTSAELDWLIQEGHLQGSYGPKVGWQSKREHVDQLRSQVGFLVEQRQDQLPAPERPFSWPKAVLALTLLIAAYAAFALRQFAAGTVCAVAAIGLLRASRKRKTPFL